MCYEERFFLQRATTKVQKREELESVIDRLRPSAPPRSPEARDGQVKGSRARAGNRLSGLKAEKPWVADAPRGFRSRPHHLACSSTLQREPHKGNQNTVACPCCLGTRWNGNHQPR